eukprot:13455052-Ditylum_brightwellii.AAC.1
MAKTTANYTGYVANMDNSTTTNTLYHSWEAMTAIRGVNEQNKTMDTLLQLKISNSLHQNT